MRSPTRKKNFNQEDLIEHINNSSQIQSKSLRDIKIVPLQSVQIKSNQGEKKPQLEVQINNELQSSMKKNLLEIKTNNHGIIVSNIPSPLASEHNLNIQGFNYPGQKTTDNDKNITAINTTKTEFDSEIKSTEELVNVYLPKIKEGY